MQALAFAVFLNFLFVAFFQPSFWIERQDAAMSQATLLMLNGVVFFCLGLIAIRNRERVRRILRTREGGGASWVDLAWPAPLMVVGTVAVSLVVAVGLVWGHSAAAEWDLDFVVFRALFFADSSKRQPVLTSQELLFKIDSVSRNGGKGFNGRREECEALCARGSVF